MSKISDWNYLAILAINNGMAPLVSKKIPLLENNHLVPPEIKEQLHQAYLKTLSRNVIIYDHFRKVALALNEAGIPVIALKGIHLSETLYKDIGLRQLSDMDIMVQDNDIPKCLSIMDAMGYLSHHFTKTRFIKLNSYFGHCYKMVINGVSFDIHTRVQYDKYRITSEDLWKNAVKMTLNGAPVCVLDYHHLLIHLCLHLEKHMSQKDFQLKCFCDITNIIISYKDELDWNELNNLCEKYECSEVFYKFIILTGKYFDAPLPESILDKYGHLADKYKDKELITALKTGSRMQTGNIVLIKGVDGFSNKIRYILHDTFPSQSYMMWRYGIRSRYLVGLYYPYRILLGIRQLAMYILRKISG
ncbi:MAG: hypothetical protein EA408_10610 [Marinilabiliales bacterium]|nr:MAG: hypothetical protein EA408_10610 [Marinilabiliales bacterium]